MQRVAKMIYGLWSKDIFTLPISEGKARNKLKHVDRFDNPDKLLRNDIYILF